MISREERQYIVKLKAWSVQTRVAITEVQKGALGALIVKVFPDKHPTELLDHVDWLIALIDREWHTTSVKAFVKAIEQHESGENKI